MQLVFKRRIVQALTNFGAESLNLRYLGIGNRVYLKIRRQLITEVFLIGQRLLQTRFPLNQ